MVSNINRRIAITTLGCSVALALALSLLGPKATGQAPKKAQAAIPVEQAITCIRTAIAAKPGDVAGAEVEQEAGKFLCEVEVLAQDGKVYEVTVDVASNAVIKTEEDND